MTITMQKNWFFPVFLLLIKVSCSVIGWETQQDTFNQKVVILGATFPWWHFSYKEHYDHMILFTDIDDQRILQSDWMKGRIIPSLDDYHHANN